VPDYGRLSQPNGLFKFSKQAAGMPHQWLFGIYMEREQREYRLDVVGVSFEVSSVILKGRESAEEMVWASTTLHAQQ
jgi:hypothetical protein